MTDATWSRDAKNRSNSSGWLSKTCNSSVLRVKIRKETDDMKKEHASSLQAMETLKEFDVLGYGQVVGNYSNEGYYPRR